MASGNSRNDSCEIFFYVSNFIFWSTVYAIVALAICHNISLASGTFLLLLVYLNLMSLEYLFFIGGMLSLIHLILILISILAAWHLRLLVRNGQKNILKELKSNYFLFSSASVFSSLGSYIFMVYLLLVMMDFEFVLFSKFYLLLELGLLTWTVWSRFLHTVNSGWPMIQWWSYWLTSYLTLVFSCWLWQNRRLCWHL